MSDPAASRPPQTSLAGWMIIGGSVFVVGSAWATVAGLRTIERREAIEEMIKEPPIDSWGVSVESVTQITHVLAMVAAGCAVLGVGLGWQVLQRDRNARLALTVLAVPLFVTGVAAGGFMASFVAAAIAMLWLSPSREWLNREQPKGPSPSARPAWMSAPGQGAPGQGAPGQGAPDRPLPPADPVDGQPGPTQGWGPPPGQTPTVAWQQPVDRPVTQRPDAILVALILTLTIAGLVFLTSLLSVTLLASQPDLVFEEVQRQNPELVDQGVSQELIRSTTYISGGIGMAWSAAAIAFAILTMRRQRWAATGLLISSALTVGLCLACTLASMVALVPGIAALVTISTLRRPDVRRWLAGDDPRLAR